MPALRKLTRPKNSSWSGFSSFVSSAICGQNLRGEESLIAQIVNGQQGLHPDESRVSAKMFAKVDRGQRGLPVMQVQDIGPEQAPRHSDGGHGKHGEAQMVIREIAGRGAVDAVAIIKRGTLHEIVGDTGPPLGWMEVS